MLASLSRLMWPSDHPPSLSLHSLCPRKPAGSFLPLPFSLASGAYDMLDHLLCPFPTYGQIDPLLGLPVRFPSHGRLHSMNQPSNFTFPGQLIHERFLLVYLR